MSFEGKERPVLGVVKEPGREVSFEGKERPSLACGTSSRRPGREVSVDGKERPAERRKGDLVVKGHLKAKSGNLLRTS